MIKIFLLKPNHPEFAPVMVAVTTNAGRLPYFLMGMVTTSLVDQGLNKSMTIKAFLIRNLFAQCVAFCTVGDTFEMLVRLSQVAGRYLRHQHHRHQQHKHEHFFVTFHNV
jgi:hypothetical protein